VSGDKTDRVTKRDRTRSSVDGGALPQKRIIVEKEGRRNRVRKRALMVTRRKSTVGRLCQKQKKKRKELVRRGLPRGQNSRSTMPDKKVGDQVRGVGGK